MKKKLYRNTDEKLLAGVLAGLAEYYGQDTALFRIAFILLLFLTGFMPGVLGYIIAMVIIPEKPTIEPVDKVDYTVVS